MIDKTPSLSIVTVNKDNATGLDATIRSVTDQPWKDFEYIVIDGGSIDDSVAVIEKFRGRIDFWTSEPDAGVYDAMNKGLTRATGEFVYFLNSGDTLDSDALAGLFGNEIGLSSYDVIYGDVLDRSTGKPIRAQPIERIYGGIPCSHQGVMVRTELHQRLPFDTSYQVAADYDLLLKLYHSGARFGRYGICFGHCEGGGLSNGRYPPIIREYIRILWMSGRGSSRLVRIAFYCWGQKKFFIYLMLRPLLRLWSARGRIGKRPRASGPETE